MIQLYTWGTPNGRKLTILMEELGVPYQIHPVNIGKNEQFAPDYLKISPNNKIPALVDDDAEGGSLSIFESGAMMIYLADKYGQFLARDGAARWSALQWLMWQMGGLGPMMGQLGWFATSAADNAQGVERYANEVRRLFGVLDKRLGEAPYVAGDDYTIADMAIWPWISQYRVRIKDHIEPLLDVSPNITAWLNRVGARDATQRGFKLP